MPRLTKARSTALLVGGLLVAQLVLISLQVPRGPAPSYFERAAFAVFGPVVRVVRGVWAGAAGLLSRHAFLRRVERQNRGLRQELFRTRAENLALRGGLAELKDRESAAALLEAAGRSFVFARVIALDSINAYESAVVDRGLRDGLRPGLPVLDRLGRLAGRIVEPVSAREATVQLVTDDNSAVGVISEKSRVLGIMAGDPVRGGAWLRYVPATETGLTPGEALVTSGSDKIYPPGLPAGEVVSVVDDGTAFKKIAVRTFLDVRDLRIAAVLTRPSGADREAVK